VANVRVPDVRRADDSISSAMRTSRARLSAGSSASRRRPPQPSTCRSHRSSWFQLARRPPVGRIDELLSVAAGNAPGLSAQGNT